MSDGFDGGGRDGPPPGGDALIVDVDGWEGPLDLLLTLARSQKVDLRRISVRELAEQYLAFIEHARDIRIELAADYLVMAAWLAFLKSRLLLPSDPDPQEASAADLAADLAFRLERLDAMRGAAAQILARNRKGHDFFARGAPENIANLRRVSYGATLLDLMRAYARLRTRDEFRPLVMDREYLAMDEALERLRGLVGSAAEWTALARFLPDEWRGEPARRRSATAATFAASLELVKAGAIEVRQSAPFAPLEIRRQR